MRKGIAMGLGALRTSLSHNTKIRKAQSMVEYMMVLPVLLVMLSGVVEAGIALNVYLDLIDGAREIARDLASRDPFDVGVSINPSFYDQAEIVSDYTLGQFGQITLDSASDNLIVSIFQVSGSTVSGRYPDRYPDLDGCDKGGELGWIAYCNSHESKIGTTDCGIKPFDCIVMADLLADLVDTPPNTGVVAVEIYYDYHLTLGLPWVAAFIPDPITFHAYSYMPNSASTP